MDRQLHELMADNVPKLNPDICNGLAFKVLPYAEAYVDATIRSASKGFPEGFEYVNCERCMPHEEYNEIVRKKSNKRVFDTARTDTYMMKYHFRYKDMTFTRFRSLPFVSEGSLMYLNGSRYTASPVLQDIVISPGLTNVFVRLLRDKPTFERVPHNFIINGVRETIQVVWSLIYHKHQSKKKIKPTVVAHCSLMHYLLCKYGFTETFKKFGKCNPVVGERNINEQTYPPSEWVICQSTGLRPKGFGKFFYKPTEIRIAIRKEDFTIMVKSMVAGFFYVLDHFPSSMYPQYIDHTKQWIILFGHILFSGTLNEGVLFDDVSKHFKSLDEYIDVIVTEKLKDIGYNCTDIYQLFAIIIENLDYWLINATEKVSSMYDKELSVLYNMLYDITCSVFNLNFKLNSAASKKELTEKGIISIMNTVFKDNIAQHLVRQHMCMSTVAYSGDNMFFKITNILVPQSTSSRMNTRKNAASIKDPSKKLHESVAEVGGYANLPKSDPTGHARINPHVKIDEKGNILRDPDKRELLDSINALLKQQ